MHNKSRNHVILFTVFGVLFILVIYIAYMYSLENKALKKSLPYLLKGEKIEYFKLVDMDAKEIDHHLLEKGDLSIIFIMSRSCSPCDKNIKFFKKITQILDNRVNFYGIILDNPSEAMNFADEAKPNFKIYVPDNLDTFVDKMRLKLNLSQIIVYTDKVELVRLGELSGNDVVQIIEFAKGLI